MCLLFSTKINTLSSDVPKVSLLYRGQTIDTFTVNEGDEIVIECSVKANPLAKVVLFLHDGIQLVSDSQSGIPQIADQMYTHLD